MGRGAGRTIVQNAIFHGKCHDNRILKVRILLSRNFVVMAKAPNQAKEAHKHELFGPVALGTTPGMSRDKPGLSLGQSGLAPGTKPGFLLVLHNGSPVCPWDHPGDQGRQKEFMC